MEDETNIDIAATLREIAANSDEITGKILKKCNKAATKGKFHIEIEIPKEDWDFLSEREGNFPYGTKVSPPYIEKLESLGFKLKAGSQTPRFWDPYKYKHHIFIWW